jgi:hypothetical protein
MHQSVTLILIRFSVRAGTCKTFQAVSFLVNGILPSSRLEGLREPGGLILYDDIGMSSSNDDFQPL